MKFQLYQKIWYPILNCYFMIYPKTVVLLGAEFTPPMVGVNEWTCDVIMNGGTDLCLGHLVFVLLLQTLHFRLLFG